MGVGRRWRLEGRSLWSPRPCKTAVSPAWGRPPEASGRVEKPRSTLWPGAHGLFRDPPLSSHIPHHFMIPGDNAVDFAICLFGFFILLLEKVIHVIFFPLKANTAMPAATVTESSPGSPVSESRLWRPWGTSVHRHLERVGACQSHGRSGGDEWGCSHKYPEKCRILRTAPLRPFFKK